MVNAVVVFTKVPKAGETKTRLTTERGGVLAPEDARDFYEACLLDVLDSCMAAACSDVYVCHNSDGDGAYLRQMLDKVADPRAIKEVFPDRGGTFDKGMQYAVDYILKGEGAGRRADAVLIVGGDMPSLQPATVREAFRKLERLASRGAGSGDGAPGRRIGPAMVVSADQECGFNLLGYTWSTPFDFDGVFYNQDGVTALDMVSYKAKDRGIPLGILEIVPDIDVVVDFAGFISVVKTMQLAARYDSAISLPARTIQALEALGLEASAPVPDGYRAA
ncbi:DUF2064 domain-containing protein [Geobacter sp. FeAm09]|uniref:TIGR04282 family arsenosugar biosynthesis glycosyltransferase n=1 Tax=Geobacter sp. FeAm09 TaxID=2597769 RepID=UPI0011EBCEEC|nr:DUF2064 domain-containing protein [Geobacter sp. FeAm09]QEM67011.1 DUF2064 domain-containing protein [Geobacter sp. FeAm09]